MPAGRLSLFLSGSENLPVRGEEEGVGESVLQEECFSDPPAAVKDDQFRLAALGSFKEPGPLRFAPYHFGPPIAKDKNTEFMFAVYMFCKLLQGVHWGQTLNSIICIRKGQRREGP